MIKMLVVDIDGTIKTRVSPISEKLKHHVKILRENGVKVVIATGRMHCSAKHVAEDLGTDEPVISYQGGLIIDSDGKVLWNKLLNEKCAKEVIEYLRKENIHINTYVNDELFVEKDSDEVKDYVSDKNISYNLIDTLDNLDYSNLNKILAIDYDEQKTIELVKYFQDKYKEELYIIRSTPNFCEVSNPLATKGNGVRFLAKMWGINQDEIMVAGDQDNDIEMLKAAGIKVAMENATDELKKVANFITKSVDEDGVCFAIEKFCDIKELKCSIE
ncbi:MAG: HAD family hydrolase [Candidatus Gastranaerophilales bacterium]|nr:HAD family hydrolase [Candidatus Gastranaerophilales bacterium]